LWDEYWSTDVGGLRGEAISTGFAGCLYTGSCNGATTLEHKGRLMPVVTYISSKGLPREVDVPSGMSVMQAALNNRVEGILGECGGNCMCATCHVYVDSEFLARIPKPTDNEKFMLSIAAEGPQPNSRLSCQIKMTDELNALTVRLPGMQR
jgi:2Fe-2S ferredoxin